MQFEQFGPYKIGRMLGRGGMGAVYEGTSVETGERAAIKVLSASLGHEAGFRERFRSEIESLKKLRHPNIVRLLGHGDQDEHLFYAMELIDGRSLEDELQDDRVFTHEEVIDIGIQTCRALKHAHDRGVIHRDIKPANLMLTRDGVIKLSDFGIAKLFGSTGLTADGGVIGTAEYMAPEQADGRPVTNRCDLYSLGGVLYALLARRPPFRAKNMLEMLQLQRFAQPEPVRRYAPDTPPELDRLIAELLVKEPEDRIATALVLSKRLQAIKDNLERRKRAPDPPQPPTAPGGIELSSSGINPTIAASQPMVPLVDDPDEMGYRLADSPSFPTRGSTAATSAQLAGAGASPAEEEVKISAPVTMRKTGSTSGGFVKVDEEELEKRELISQPATEWISYQTWVLVAALLLIGGWLWWLQQPSSADSLYNAIVAKAEAEDPAELTSVEDKIEEFLEYYPSDPRRREVLSYQEDIETYRLERRFDIRARRHATTGSFTAIERKYFEIRNQVQVDPRGGIEKLEALIDTFGEKEDTDPTTRQILELARRQLAQLQKQREEYARESIPMIQSRLARAEELRGEEPERAAEIWRGIIELYGGEPWAEKHVKAAEEALAAMPAVAANDSGENTNP